MFSTGKLFSRPQKARKNHSMAYHIMVWFCLIIEILLGINVAFLVDQNLQIVAHNMMDGVTLLGISLGVLAPAVAFMISMVVAACFALGGMWTFAGFLDTYKDAEAYERAEATWGPWPRGLVIILLVLVIALDFATLEFRAAYFAEKGADPLFAFFCVLIILPFVLGCVIHVLENTPRDRRQTKAYNYAQQVSTGDEERAVQYMTPEERDVYLSGNRDDAMASYYARMDGEQAAHTRVQQEREEYRQQRRDEKAETREKRRNPFLKAVPTQADGNGHRSA